MLTVKAVENAKPAGKPYKLTDERGMFLLVQPNGSKLWRFRYRINGRQKVMALGAFPDVSLARARDLRDEARKLVKSDVPVDPVQDRRRKRTEARASELNTFESVAREWLDTFSPSWSASTIETKKARLEQYLLPDLGRRPLMEIEAAELLTVLKKIEAKGTLETTRRVRQIFSQVARYGIATSRAKHDVSADLRGALTPPKVNNRAAIVKPEEAAGLLRVLDGYNGTIIVRCALRLAPLVFVRPGELRQAEWSEINWMESEWTIPKTKTKMRKALTVPLSRQALEILREIYRVTGHGRFVFPSGRGGDRPMSENAVLAALRRMGIPKDEMTGHGFRALARTILDEVLQVRVDWIEHQLGHQVMGPLGAAYARMEFLKERRVMMQQWADYLDQLKAGDPAALRVGGAA
jgi:integrase